MSSEPSTIPDDVKLALKDYTTITALPVQWGDQDSFGHVNNVVYFRWFESARIELLDQFPTAVTMSGKGLGPILASIKCDYRRQLSRVVKSPADAGRRRRAFCDRDL